MLKCRAIQKVTNKHGQTVGYILQDGTGKTMSVATENIKYAIHNGQVN
jgi:GR25 family glycosyltransferase involved in LPS biosynthesis